MTIGEAKEFITLHLKGDNSTAVVEPLHIKTAILDIAVRCEPSVLAKPYTGVETDVFRIIQDNYYIRKPVIGNDTTQLDIDEDLSLACVFFVCSYLSHKYKDIFEQRAEKVIAMYVSNIIV